MITRPICSMAVAAASLVVAGTGYAQVYGVPGDGCPDLYYFPTGGLFVTTSAGVLTRPAGTLLLDTDAADVVAVLVGGPNGLTNCDLCDSGFLPDPNNPPFLVSTWTVGFINGSTQWIRTAPLTTAGYTGVIGEDPDPSSLFPEFGLTNYGPGLSDGDFPKIFGGGAWSVRAATNGGADIFTDVKVLSAGPPAAIPTVGEWGVIVMGLLLIGGLVVIGRRLHLQRSLTPT